MSLFYYKALTSDDQLIEGQIEATSQSTVVSKLQSMGYFPISTEPVSEKIHNTNGLFAKDISQADVRLLTQKLAIMMKAGLTLDAALVLLIETADSVQLKTLLEKVMVSVHNGLTLSYALEQHSIAFDRFYMNTLKAGESSGALDVVLQRLSSHLEQSYTIRKNVQSALIYPAILVAVAVITLLILLVYVVPQFQVLFEDMGRALPLSTQIVITIADAIKTYGWLVAIAIFLAGLMLKKMLRNTQSRHPIDKFILKLPLVASMVIRLEVARFSRTLATLLGNGVPMLSALTIVSESVNNTVIRQALNTTKKEVQEGRPLATALQQQSVFPSMATQLFQVGEEAGELVDILDQVADIYDEELKDTIQRFLTLLEPILIIGMGIIIAAIIISILLAILSLNDFAA